MIVNAMIYIDIKFRNDKFCAMNNSYKTVVISFG